MNDLFDNALLQCMMPCFTYLQNVPLKKITIVTMNKYFVGQGSPPIYIIPCFCLS